MHIGGIEKLLAAAQASGRNHRQTGQQILDAGIHGTLHRRQTEPGPRPVEGQVDRRRIHPGDVARLIRVQPGGVGQRRAHGGDVIIGCGTFEIGDERQALDLGRQVVALERHHHRVIDRPIAFFGAGNRVIKRVVDEGIVATIYGLQSTGIQVVALGLGIRCNHDAVAAVPF